MKEASPFPPPQISESVFFKNFLFVALKIFDILDIFHFTRCFCYSIYRSRFTLNVLFKSYLFIYTWTTFLSIQRRGFSIVRTLKRIFGRIILFGISFFLGRFHDQHSYFSFNTTCHSSTHIAWQYSRTQRNINLFTTRA